MTIRLRSRGNNKAAYYAAAVLREAVPGFVYRARRAGILATGDADPVAIADRVDYCNRLTDGAVLAADAPRIRDISFARSTYAFDLREHARYFDPNLRLPHLFGDVMAVPPVPTVVKSRPIAPDNANAVLMKLDRYRHFYFPADRLSFAEKRPMAVWRGTLNNARRSALLERYIGHALADVGHTDRNGPAGYRRPFMPVSEQLGYRYVISIEGWDVATNLKWAMASNSLCMMPAPVYETWFMEGRLEPGRHYVLLRDDMADLEEKILHYERHGDEAREIIRNANAWVARFRDRRRERLVSLLVLGKFFEKTGQMEGADV